MIQAQEALTHFPRALSDYPDAAGASILQILQSRIEIEPFNVVATGIFLLAILHTFAAARFAVEIENVGLNFARCRVECRE